jgi:hypothetical protein
MATNAYCFSMSASPISAPVHPQREGEGQHEREHHGRVEDAEPGAAQEEGVGRE